jgi:hypothetical protein
MKAIEKKLWLILLALAIISPLGIILPRLFKARGAWGEWGPETIAKMIGYVPEGLKRMAYFWHAPISDYSLGGEGTSLVCEVLYYTGSALLGIVLTALLVWLITKIVRNHEK